MILVDDGLATGSSTFAAIESIRAQESTCRQLGRMVDDVVCATVPSPFRAVGASYWDYDQVTDDEVRTLLATDPTTRVLPPCAKKALRGFERLPAWKWRDTVVRDFVAWLRDHNDDQVRNDEQPTGFYGLACDGTGAGYRCSARSGRLDSERYAERTGRSPRRKARKWKATMRISRSSLSTNAGSSSVQRK